MHYGAVCAVCDVSIEVSRRETLAILGPSGSGKTSLLRLIAGFERPDCGMIVIDEKTASTSRIMMAPNRRCLAMIFQDLALWPHMSVLNNVAFALKGCQHSEEADRADELLARVSLHRLAKRYPHQLSGGEKQRLALARALASQPAYLLMDEPFSSLDPLLTGEMLDLTEALIRERGFGVIHVTHDFQAALRLSDRIAVMEKGRLPHCIDKAHSMTQTELLQWYSECLRPSEDACSLA